MTATTDSPPTAERADPRRVLAQGVAGAVLLWLAQPPVGWSPLAWIGVAVWVDMAAPSREWSKRARIAVWGSAVVYWLMAVWWVTLPHPLTKFGWPLLAMYLGLYPLATLSLVRAASRRWRVPVWIAAPVAWTALELVQARLFTGFLMGAVSHSQADQAWLRSIAGYAGAYGVTFCVVLVGALLARWFRSHGVAAAVRNGAITAAAAAAVAGAGLAAREALVLREPQPDAPLVALVQSDARATWDGDPDQKNRQIMDRLSRLTTQAAEQADGPLDLVVWPESMFRPPVVTFAGSTAPPPGVEAGVLRTVDNTSDWLHSLTSRAGGAWLLLGVDRFDRDGDKRSFFNSVALIDPGSDIQAIYDKTHLVPFGEYIPLASGLPALYYLTPMSGGLSSGEGPVGMRIATGRGVSVTVCPTICYETVVPHVVRGHVASLVEAGERPDALVNVTNDAWFWGSSELPMHLACGQFRAVENGAPLLIAANGGLSAIVDATGRVVEATEAMTEATLVVRLPPATQSPTPYTLWGDWFAGGCLALSGAVAVGLFARKPVRRNA